MTIIILTIFSIGTLILLVIDVFNASILLSTFLAILAFVSLFGWIYFASKVLNQKRINYFEEKIKQLDRKNSCYEVLFIIYDFIHQEENNIEVVRKAMNQVYFFSKRVANHPDKVRRKALYNLLIDYYLSLSISKLKISFFWNYNINFFTWKMIGITTLIGTAGILILYFCHIYSFNSNEILFTSLYFTFGVLEIPFIAKLFGHFI